MQEVLLSTLLADPGQHAESLYSTGKQWGQSWSKDFMNIEGRRFDVSSPRHVERVLREWSDYDASAGMGRIEFTFGADGLPTEADVANGFLSIERNDVDLRNLIAGYLAGSLDGLLGSQGLTFEAALSSKTVGRDIYTLSSQRLAGHTSASPS